MKEWNVLITATRGEEKYLLRFLEEYGEFKGSGFRDVVLGWVEDVDAFLKRLEDLRLETPVKLNCLSQIVPLGKTLHFDVFDFMDKLREVISPFVEKIENKKFYVRVKRRGHKGEISSQKVEKEMAGFILDTLEKGSKRAQVGFEDPDVILIVETIGNWAGVGLIGKEMREKYSGFIRVK